MLNKHSGLLGISGLTGDMRDLLAEEAQYQDRRARLAIDVFCQRVKKYIGGYAAVLDRVDSIVFTGGIGQNAPDLRARICADMHNMGIELDEVRNERTRDGAMGKISRDDAPMGVYVIPTNEELLIARDTYRVIAGVPMP
jgi:acetate kinase